MLASINFTDTQLSTENWSNLRVGGFANWQIAPWLEAKSFITYDRNDGDEMTINSFSLRLKKKKAWLEFGKMATPSTEIRPLPPTGNGQFETWTEATLPGGVPGVKIGYQFNSKNSLSFGTASRQGKPEYSVLLTHKNFKATADYQLFNKKTTIGFSLAGKGIYQVLT